MTTKLEKNMTLEVYEILTRPTSLRERAEAINELQLGFTVSLNAVHTWDKKIASDPLLAERIRESQNNNVVGTAVQTDEHTWQGILEADCTDAAIIELCGGGDHVVIKKVITRGPSWVRYAQGEDAVTRNVVRFTATVMSPSAMEGIILRQGPAVTVKVPKRKPIARPSDTQVALLSPDPQIGYRTVGRDALVSTHDERAIDVVRQVDEMLQADIHINLGDFMDFPGLSRYEKPPEEHSLDLLQKSIDRGTEIAATMMACAQRKVIIEGNHDLRVQTHLVNSMSPLTGLCPGGEETPLVTLPRFLQLERAGIEWVDGYPAGEFEIFAGSEFYAIHGRKVNSRGSTVHGYLNDPLEPGSFACGHIHSFEYGQQTHPRTGKITHALSPGTLSKVDGAVPSVKNARRNDGSRTNKVENWQQGFAVVTYRPSTDETFVEMVPIQNGKAMFRGTEIVADDEFIADSTAWLTKGRRLA